MLELIFESAPVTALRNKLFYIMSCVIDSSIQFRMNVFVFLWGASEEWCAFGVKGWRFFCTKISTAIFGHCPVDCRCYFVFRIGVKPLGINRIASSVFPQHRVYLLRSPVETGQRFNIALYFISGHLAADSRKDATEQCAATRTH